jgi:hypothetical protein
MLRISLALFLLAAPALARDLVVTKKKHEDAYSMMGQEQPAKDTTEVTWIAEDRMRVEDGDQVFLVRSDLKKLFVLDKKAKTYSALDLPLDLAKYMPAEYAPMIQQMTGQITVSVAVTGETRKIGEWNATRYTVTTTLPMGGSDVQEIWATKDVPLDLAALQDMRAAMLALNPMGGTRMADEMKKIDGVAILVERTRTMMGAEAKARDEVTSIEQREPSAGLYDPPADFTEKPFDPMAAMGGPRPGGGRRGPR